MYYVDNDLVVIIAARGSYDIRYELDEQNLNLNTDNQLISFQENENGYLFSILEKTENTLKPKVIQTDLNLQPQKTTELNIDGDLSITEIKLIDNKFLFTANKISTLEQLKSNNHSIESYYIAKIFDEKGFNYLEKAITTRDGSVILFGNSTQQGKGSNGQSDFYLVKLGDKSSTEKRTYIEAYPNPTRDIVNVLINKEFVKATIEVYNLTGQHLQTKEVKYRSTPISLESYSGGIYILKINTDNQTESIKIIKK